MKISGIQTFYSNNICRINNFNKTSFKGDILDFTSVTKEKMSIIKNLQNIGISNSDAAQMIDDYYNTQEYNKLVHGEVDEVDNETYPAHSIDIGRNLSPEEAVVYMAYDMDKYYMQYIDCFPEEYAKSTIESQKYDIGEAKFSPILLAKEMQKGYDIVMSGMLLKGKIDDKTAEEVNKYYDTSYDKYSHLNNVQAAEYTIDLLANNLDKLRNWTSDEKNSDGTLKNGLSRALTADEAATLVTCDYLPSDNESLNHYIEMNKKGKYTLIDMDINALWDKRPEEVSQSQNDKNIVNLRTQRHFETLQERLDALISEGNGTHNAFYEDMKLLDDNKFGDRITSRGLKYDAIMSSSQDRNQRRKNIQVLNSLSEELLEKMAPSKNGVKGHFAMLHKLLKVDNLEDRVKAIEVCRKESPMMFDSLSSEAVMDFLTDSTFYSDTKQSLDEFYSMLTGEVRGESSQEPDIAKILPFNNNQED